MTFFFFQAAALVAQAHLTSGPWHPVKAQGQELHHGGDSWPLLLVGTTTASSPHSSRGGMGPVRACWHFAGMLWAAALLGSKAREIRLPLLPHRQAHTVLAVRGGCFGAIITPALRESPIEFLFTYLSLHVQTKSPSVVVLWEDVSPFSFQPPDLHPLVLWVPAPLFQVPPALPTPGACRCSIP